MHEQLWAPWRLPYIVEHKDDRPSGCFLCRYRDQADDDGNYVVARGATSLVVLNRFPYNNGHMLVAPLAHKGGLDELSDAELLECQRQLQQMTSLISRTLHADGFNLGLNVGRAAGAGLPGHLHWHLVPRWQGDTNFMSVTAATKVIPQSLAALYNLLRAQLQGGTPAPSP